MDYLDTGAMYRAVASLPFDGGSTLTNADWSPGLADGLETRCRRQGDR